MNRGEPEHADHFAIEFCDDPNCGPHIIAFRSDNEVICEINMTAKQALEVLSVIKTELYNKAVSRD
jgi:hypothetical protein